MIRSSVMEAIDRAKANELLAPLGMNVGSWNELSSLPSVPATHRAYSPPTDAMELYVAANRLANWIGSGSWTLLQVDNSTSPSDDELAIFERLVLNGRPWDVAEQHTFLLGAGAQQSTLVLLVYFSLLFTWHVHLASEASLAGQRLALQDGIAYFFGDSATIQSADELIASLAADPRILTP
jgi:hypothetical protein